MNNMMDFARKYLERGWKVVPIPCRTKKPVLKDWQNLKIDKASLSQYFHGLTNIGVLLGEPSGWLADIDLDSKEAVQVAPFFLPPTSAVFGRNGRPWSHSLYVCPNARTIKYETREETIVELRANGQTVFPGSIHPSGEKIRWDEEGNPAHITFPELKKAVAKVAAAALLARHWPGVGTRQNCSMAMAGWLLRHGWTREETEKFVEATATAAGDDEVKQRVTQVRNTAQKVEAGSPVTGLPSLCEYIDGTALRKAAGWLEIRLLQQSPSMSMQETAQRVEQVFGKSFKVEIRELPSYLSEKADLAVKEKFQSTLTSTPRQLEELLVSPCTRASEEIEWIVPDLIPSGYATILGGHPKVGKSWLALRLACDISVGGNILDGLRWIKKPRRVLYVMADSDHRQPDGRLQKTEWKFNSENLKFVFQADLMKKNMELNILNPKGKELLEKLIEAHGADIVFLDSLSSITGDAELKEERVLKPVMRYLNSLSESMGIGLVALHHARKPKKEQEKATMSQFDLSGAGIVMRLAGYSIGVELKPSSNGRPETHLAKYLAGWERGFQPFGFTLVDQAEENGKVLVIMKINRNPYGDNKKEIIWNVIQKYFSSAWFTRAELQRELPEKICESYVKTMLNELVKDGRLERRGYTRDRQYCIRKNTPPPSGGKECTNQGEKVSIEPKDSVITNCTNSPENNRIISTESSTLCDMYDSVTDHTNQITESNIVIERKNKDSVINFPPHVTPLSDLRQKLGRIQNARVIALDIETAGLDPIAGEIRLIQIGIPGEPVILIDYFKVNKEIKRLIQEILQSPCLKIFHNGKFDLKFLIQNGFQVEGPFFDTMLAEQVLDSGVHRKGFELADLADRYLGIELSKDLQKSDWSKELTEAQLRYAALDVAVLLEIYREQVKALRDTDLTQVVELECECLPSVIGMELRGMRLDLDKWEKLTVEVTEKKQEIQQELQVELGAGINPNSPKQLLSALRLLGISVDSTKRDELSRHAQDYPVIGRILEYRKYDKSLSSFLEKLPEKSHPVTHRIHPEYRQIGTRTGRFSCNNPNLQQIPRDVALRECFIPEEGHRLIFGDYSQIELLVTAEISEDERMIEAFRRGEDLHRFTASLITGENIEDITSEERQLAKALNFGLLFGMGARGFRAYALQNYGVAMSEREAEKFRSKFFKSYQGLKSWQNRQKNTAMETRTLVGRRRILEKPPQFTEKCNTPIQGTAADILKRALGLLYQKLKNTGIQIIAVVHDEIILETPEEKAEEAAAILKSTMEEAGSLLLKKVPVVAEVRVAKDWGEK